MAFTLTALGPVVAADSQLHHFQRLGSSEDITTSAGRKSPKKSHTGRRLPRLGGMLAVSSFCFVSAVLVAALS